MIDAHQHFWRYDEAEYGWIDQSMAALRRDFLPSDAEPEMARAGVTAAIAVQARQSLEETAWLLSLADAHPWIAGVVGWVDLQADDATAQIDRFTAHPKFVGVRHVVQGEADDQFLLRPAFCRGIAALEERGLTYDILIHPHHLPVAAEFVSRFPRQRFVLDHLAKPQIKLGEIRRWERNLRRLAEQPHVMAKLSGLVTEASWQRWTLSDIRPYLEVALECFGASRLMIGSDWPVCLVASTYARVIDVVFAFASRLPAADRDAVLHGNARRFWRLDETRSGGSGASARVGARV